MRHNWRTNGHRPTIMIVDYWLWLCGSSTDPLIDMHSEGQRSTFWLICSRTKSCVGPQVGSSIPQHTYFTTCTLQYHFCANHSNGSDVDDDVDDDDDASHVKRTRFSPTATTCSTTSSTLPIATSSWRHFTLTSTTTGSTTHSRCTRPTCMTRPWKSPARSTTQRITCRLSSTYSRHRCSLFPGPYLSGGFTGSNLPEMVT